MRRLGLVLLSALVLVAGFFIAFELEARQLVEDAGLAPRYYNAVKHARAAETVYRMLVKLEHRDPQRATLWLGELNERVEQVVKFRSPDSTLETMKDLHNNIMGIQAGRSACEDGVIRLAKAGALRVKPETLPFPNAERARLERTRDLAEAFAWQETQRETLAKKATPILASCAETKAL